MDKDNKDEIESFRKFRKDILIAFFIFASGVCLGKSLDAIPVIIGTAIVSIVAIAIRIIYHINREK